MSQDGEISLEWIKANRWILGVAMAAVLLGAEQRWSLGLALAQLEKHAALPAHQVAGQEMAVVQSETAAVQRRLNSLEEGQAELADKVAKNGATGEMVLEELREMRREMRR